MEAQSFIARLIRVSPYVLFAALLILSSKVPLFPIAGSDKAFTLSNIIMPLAMKFFNPALGILLILAAKGVESGLVLKAGLFALPSIFAAYAFRYPKHPLNAALPLAGVVAFIIHPAGMSYYVALWVIPFIAYFFSDNLVARSFLSTYTAHITGSVIFLYTFPTSSAFWNALVPIAFTERLVFALGIALTYKAMAYLIALANAKADAIAKAQASPTRVEVKLREQ